MGLLRPVNILGEIMAIKTFISGIFIAMLFFSVPAESEDWLNYVEIEGGGQVYVDMESIESTSGNTMRVVKKVEPSGTTAIASVVSVVEMDCEKNMIRYLKETTYYKGGKTSSSSKNEEFRKVTVEDVD
jgi:hypothetical protein